MQRIAIFASGTGSNAVRIIEHFNNHPNIKVCVVVSNKSNAPVLAKAQQAGVETFAFNRDEFYQSDLVLNELKKREIDLIVLAGFMWLVPENLIKTYTDRIINIHPALLPNYGGKGMYGMHVHRAVKAAGETETGITIHLVNEEYDRGEILFQAKCSISEEDTPEDIAQKIHQLEHANFSEQIERYLQT
ncbi:phosphoribosylglycinamide formyltransferase, partial [Bacteroidota bacterium]